MTSTGRVIPTVHRYHCNPYHIPQPQLSFSHTNLSRFFVTSDMDLQDFENINGMLDRETQLREVTDLPNLMGGADLVEPVH